MPTYEYECKKCSHSFEAFQSITDEPLTKCPECGEEIRRLIFGGAGVIFKGSGFYVTDKNKFSETKGSAVLASKDGKKTAETATADAVKSDAKTDGKSPGNDVSGGADKTAVSSTEAKKDGTGAPSKTNAVQTA